MPQKEAKRRAPTGMPKLNETLKEFSHDEVRHLNMTERIDTRNKKKVKTEHKKQQQKKEQRPAWQ